MDLLTWFKIMFRNIGTICTQIFCSSVFVFVFYFFTCEPTSVCAGGCGGERGPNVPCPPSPHHTPHHPTGGVGRIRWSGGPDQVKWWPKNGPRNLKLVGTCSVHCRPPPAHCNPIFWGDPDGGLPKAKTVPTFLLFFVCFGVFSCFFLV